MKRAFDLLASVGGLMILWPILALAAVLIKLDSRGTVLFKQERIGRGFRPFLIYKFRTMIPEAQRQGAAITAASDPRVTRIGRILRKSKIDELPQLINVLRGEMSIVGPRPEVSRYVEMFRDDYSEILKVRPGITDLASLKYRDEAAVLAASKDPENEYVARILPEKIKLAKVYVYENSLALDLKIILRTLIKLVCYDNKALISAGK